jgi:peptidoglycan/LPS O-acetylase OafA/YrhL
LHFAGYCVYTLKSLGLKGAGGEILQKLDQLTSLRFFAAVLIVIHHTMGCFGLVRPTFAFDHSVSFFFVLSGFILFYVYPELKNWKEIRLFWRARIARIWPLHFASFVLMVWLLAIPLSGDTALANLTLIQAWIPLSKYYFSYNGPTWCVSVELFFYLVFPLFVLKSDRIKESVIWFLRLFIPLLIIVTLIVLSTAYHLPNYGDPVVTTHGVFYINPLARILEFAIGVFAAHIYNKQRERIQWTPFRATAYEAVTILLAIASMKYAHYVAHWAATFEPSGEWLGHNSTFPVFGILVFVFAIGKGKLSAILKQPVLILLGELSYSMYLLHIIILSYHRMNMAKTAHLPNLLTFSAFCCILFVSSYLMWRLIERPCRRWIIGHRERAGILRAGVSERPGA